MITLILGLALVGFVCWLLLTYVPMPDPIKKLIIVIVVVCIILYLMSAFGIMDIPVPRLRGR